jgi:hypothetical protein
VRAALRTGLPWVPAALPPVFGPFFISTSRP